ncbi:YhgE/Pip domain-containing protein [Leifsonia sp. Leaf264]|uniref:YhgE/Pip domain-containing protein n=1 Tax=Leifsonia sp. Leaf264 TaxID=1736314 RepID=UPI0006F4FCF1|nr:YhgE/Pip domain-containing protein [Leifsonia sp. Leaf264]KQP00877.1 hypothetical protein ASF30_21925 [Leifsonia sp. Leaf264]
MKVPQMITAELRRLTSSRMSVIALIALVCVPVIYGGLYLWANQDPYAKLSEIPVALVVDDTGAADGNKGDDVADTLVDAATFDWHEVSAADAEAGVADGTYDFSVTFPEDFSADLESSSTDDPRKAEVILSTNDANSYLASTIGEQAVKTIQTQIVRSVGENAAITFLDSLSEIRGKLAEAADGASQLADGAAQAVDGSAELADGAAQLADGNAALATGSSTLSSGLSQLATGAGSAADGAAQLSTGASTLSDGAAQTAAGAAQVAAGNAALAAQADQIGAAVGDAAAALPQTKADIRQRLIDAGAAPATVDEALALLDPLDSRIQDANTKVQDTVGQIDQLSDGAAQVAAGTQQVADGSAQLSTGASSLADGTATLAAKTGEAASGAAQLATGAATASDGAAKLSSGATELADKLPALESGAAELRDGLAAGRDQIPESTQATRDAQATNIADPVTLETGAVTSAGSYGAGLAPFFAALAGWIGIYALFLIVKPVSRRAVTALHSPIRVTLAGWLTPTLLGAVQMSSLYLVLSWALGFHITNPAGMLGIMLLASATFAAIVLALNVWLGSVGQFLGLVLMVLQLVTAGGTFPWQTLPGPLASLHHVLPMGFVVDALRQAMYGGNAAAAWSDVGVLLLWLIGAFTLAAIGVTRMTHHRTLRDLRPSLIG